MTTSPIVTGNGGVLVVVEAPIVVLVPGTGSAAVVVEGMEGVSIKARLIESEEGYIRLLWDYSDGNPRAALHFFVRSLDPDRGSRVRVRLFKAPDVDLCVKHLCGEFKIATGWSEADADDLFGHSRLLAPLLF